MQHEIVVMEEHKSIMKPQRRQLNLETADKILIVKMLANTGPLLIFSGLR